MRQSNAGFWALLGLGIAACKGPAPAARPGLSASASSSDSIGVMTVPSAPPLRIRPPAAPRSAFAGESPLWTACSDHFEPGAAAHVDLLRLGMLCGPANGLALLARATGTVDEAREPFSYQWEAERGDCFRVFGVAELPVDDLEVEVFGPHRERLFLENQNRRWVVAAEDGPFCAPHAGTFEARFSTHGGHGTVAVSVWRGARMLAAGASRAKTAPESGAPEPDHSGGPPG